LSKLIKVIALLYGVTGATLVLGAGVLKMRGCHKAAEPAAVSGTIERGATRTVTGDKESPQAGASSESRLMPSPDYHGVWYLFVDSSGPCQAVEFGPEASAALLRRMKVPGSEVEVIARSIGGDKFAQVHGRFPQPDGTVRDASTFFAASEAACWRVIAAFKNLDDQQPGAPTHGAGAQAADDPGGNGDGGISSDGSIILYHGVLNEPADSNCEKTTSLQVSRIYQSYTRETGIEFKVIPFRPNDERIGAIAIIPVNSPRVADQYGAVVFYYAKRTIFFDNRSTCLALMTGDVK
jgi:hypothetical protein